MSGRRRCPMIPRKFLPKGVGKAAIRHLGSAVGPVLQAPHRHVISKPFWNKKRAKR